jgi:Uma2 family endonuclease
MHATQASDVHPRRWTRAEYDRMIDHGLLDEDDRVELIDGEILELAPQHSIHSAMVAQAQKVLEAAFGSGYHARVQMPFLLDPMSEPEPDIAVVSGVPRDYLEAHPHRAALLVEVAETTLRFDRKRKASLCARAGIPEYWIVNLVERLLEVHREPAVDPSARYGWAYATVEQLRASDSVSPLAATGVRIPVVDLLP